MDYDDFCNILQTELPLNRKERFYTGTILPALLFHNGLNNFYAFLQTIKGFPPEINEVTTDDNFLFYTEYNLKASAGEKRNVGRIILTETNETPDVVIEIVKPKRIFIIIEAKMFHNVSQKSLSSQISKQRKAVIEPLKQAFQLEDSQVFHVALVPQKSQLKSGKHYQVINWDCFINNEKVSLDNNYFHNYLRFALDNYKELVAKHEPPGTVEDYKAGEEIYRSGKNSGSFWVGRKGGREKIIEDVKSKRWYRHNYPINKTSLSPPTINWISAKDFKDLIDRYENRGG